MESLVEKVKKITTDKNNDKECDLLIGPLNEGEKRGYQAHSITDPQIQVYGPNSKNDNDKRTMIYSY